MRADFALQAEDMEWLGCQGRPFELVNQNGVLRVVLYGITVPKGYNVDAVDINVRIESGYPDTQIDMAYFFPALARTDGKGIGATSPDTFDGKTWQRWSRHRTPANSWRPGVDNLSTHFGLIQDWLERELRK